MCTLPKNSQTPWTLPPKICQKPHGPSPWIFNLCASMNLVVKRNDFKSSASTKQEILLFITNVNGIIIVVVEQWYEWKINLILYRFSIWSELIFLAYLRYLQNKWKKFWIQESLHWKLIFSALKIKINFTKKRT
jgi:hypothetical protein